MMVTAGKCPRIEDNDSGFSWLTTIDKELEPASQTLMKKKPVWMLKIIGFAALLLIIVYSVLRFHIYDTSFWDRNTEHLVKYTSDASSKQPQYLESQTSLRNKNEKSKHARFLIFAGPHKTGTTSIQSWFDSHWKFLLKHGWVWPRDQHGKTRKKYFGYFVWSLLKINKIEISQGGEFSRLGFNGSSHEGEEMVQWLNFTIREHLQNGLNVVIHSEEFDYVNIESFKDQILSGIRSISPFSAEVVVMIRFPRWRHMMSCWSQTRHLLRKPVSVDFGKWSCESIRAMKIGGRGSIPIGSALRPVRLAQRFQSSGFDTTLVNYSSINPEDYVDTLIHHFLGLNTNKRVIRHRHNANKGNISVDKWEDFFGEERLDRLEAILSAHDCLESEIDGLRLMNLDLDYFQNCDFKKLKKSISSYIIKYCDY